MRQLIDQYNRKIDYLRISVTDRCNLRCIYCMPAKGIINKSHSELLTFEEIIQIAKVFISLGVDKIRLTGGEPLVRKGLIDLISSLNKINGIKDISLTTNGILLKEYAQDLKKAGLKRLNISLDSLNDGRYQLITRGGSLEDVWEGIEKSLEIGFHPIKINVLLLDDIREDEILNFLRFTFENPICVRFLEYMPVNSFYKTNNPVSSKIVMEIAEKIGEIKEVENLGNGPAREYKFRNALGSFGVISPISNKFCVICNRLRLTSDGFLKLCLHSDSKINLRDPLRSGINEKELAVLIKSAVDLKPREHFLDKDEVRAEEFSMCQIGG